MKIAILSLASRLGGTTGDCVQANKTAAALRDLNQDVLRCYLRGDQVLDEKGVALGDWATVLGAYDIVHTVPPIPRVYFKGLQPIKAKFVSSTVFWRSWTYVRVMHRIHGSLTLGLLKEYIRVFLAWLHVPFYWSYKAYDLLLPNSEDEIRNFLRYCFVKRGARLAAVPNAIDPIPAFVTELSRPADIPVGDYIVVPAVFAERKNQRSLIQALQDSPCTVVFMGGGDCLEPCRAIANSHMIFLGHVAHGTERFYALLKHARVCCLPSNCETPGIAGLEAAALGVRPVVPYEGGTAEYYGWDAEYLDSLDLVSIRGAIDRAWARGRLSAVESDRYGRLTWSVCAQRTLDAYRQIVDNQL